MATCGNVIEDYCRLCAVQTTGGVVIYSSEGLDSCLEEKIVQCLRIEVSKNDMLPKKVCKDCRSQLEESYKFAERAARVQRSLELLLQMKLSPDSCLKMKTTENGVEVKNDPDHVQVKDELPEVPLNVTLVSDSDSQIETKENSSDEDSVIEALIAPVTRDLKCSATSERPQRCSRRRKMLQPQKAAAQAKPRRIQTRRSTRRPTASSSDKESEEEDDEDEEDSKVDNILSVQHERLQPSETLDRNSAKELQDEEENFKEDIYGEEEFEDDEEDKNSKEEWKAHWGIKCNECEQVFPFKSQFDKHFRTSYEKKPVYTCSYCNKTMEKYSTFRSHCYRHVTEGRYRCEYCQKGFSLRSMLHVHVLAKHTTVKPFICEECGKGFVTKPGLNIHLKKHKNNEKLEYPCADCGKILHTRGGLTAHQNVHKLGRRFMCDVCGKTFTQKVNMQQHVKHHTGERPYACEKCGKCFAEKSHLNRHYSFHSEKRPFQCSICLKMYKTERCLKVHAMVHAEARPYVCTYCNKGFLSTTKLKQHYNIHTGERPYACKFCERTFTNYPNWLKHTRRRHKVDPKSIGPLQNSGDSIPQVQQQQQDNEEAEHQHLQQNQLTQHHHQQQQQQMEQCQLQEQPLVLMHHLHPEMEDVNNRLNVAHVQLQVPIACNSNPGVMTMMPPYPHQVQTPHHQPNTMQPLQVYPDHMMAAMHIPHHHMLPL